LTFHTNKAAYLSSISGNLAKAVACYADSSDKKALLTGGVRSRATSVQQVLEAQSMGTL